MKTISTFLVLLLLPVFSSAGSKPDLLASLVQKAIDRADAEPVKGAMAEKLGFSPGSIALSLRLQHTVAPDGKDHLFSVIVHSNRTGRPIPDAIKIGMSGGKTQGKEIFVDGFVFRVDMNGSIQKAFHNSGIIGHVSSEELPADKRKVRKILEKEIDLLAANIK